MRRYGYLVLALLAACSSPHPAFMSAEAQVIEVQGSTFKVRIKGDRAEAIRTNFEFVPKIGDTFPKASRAIEIASGCTVVPNSMKGDPALMVAKLNCG